MKKYGRLILFGAFLLTPLFAHTQDRIIKDNNDTIFCKIVEVNENNIRFRMQEGTQTVTNTMNIKYVSSYLFGEKQQEAETINVKKKQGSAFRFVLNGGYARQLGKMKRTHDWKLDKLSKDLASGFHVGADIEYYFNWKEKDGLNFGVGLNLDYINHNVTGYDIDLPDVGHTKYYKETQTAFYAGPDFIMRYDWTNWIFTAFIGYGAVFVMDDINTEPYKMRGVNTVFGSNTGIGADYKISPVCSIGVKVSVTGGYYEALTIGGQKWDLGEKMSATSWLISGVISFRTK